MDLIDESCFVWLFHKRCITVVSITSLDFEGIVRRTDVEPIGRRNGSVAFCQSKHTRVKILLSFPTFFRVKCFIPFPV